MDKSVLFQDPSGEWRWKRTAPNGERVASSSEGYSDKADAEANYDRVNGPEAPELEPDDIRQA